MLVRPDVHQVFGANRVFAGAERHSVLFAKGAIFLLNFVPVSPSSFHQERPYPARFAGVITFDGFLRLLGRDPHLRRSPRILCRYFKPALRRPSSS